MRTINWFISKPEVKKVPSNHIYLESGDKIFILYPELSFPLSSTTPLSTLEK